MSICLKNVCAAFSVLQTTFCKCGSCIALCRHKTTPITWQEQQGILQAQLIPQEQGLNCSLILYLHGCLHPSKHHQQVQTTAPLLSQLGNSRARKREKHLVPRASRSEDTDTGWKHREEGTCLPGTAPRCRRMDPVLLGRTVRFHPCLFEG